MADPRIAAIRDSIGVNFDETKALLDRLSPADLQRTAANGWTVGQLAGHVAVSPSSAIYVVSRLAKGGNATVPAFLSWVPALRNWFITRRYKSATTADMLKTADDARTELLAWLGTVQDEQLDREGEVFGTGHTSLAKFLDYILEHGREHRAEIDAALS
jgi:uncharacterized damage-inducible protein DinB